MGLKSSYIGVVGVTQRLHILYAVVLFLIASFQLYMAYEFSVDEDFVFNKEIADSFTIYFFVLVLNFLVFHLLLKWIRRRRTMINKLTFMWMLLYFRMGVIGSLPMFFRTDMINPYSSSLLIISILILLYTIPNNYKVGSYLNLTEAEFVEEYEKITNANVTK